MAAQLNVKAGKKTNKSLAESSCSNQSNTQKRSYDFSQVA